MEEKLRADFCMLNPPWPASSWWFFVLMFLFERKGKGEKEEQMENGVGEAKRK